MCGPDHSVATLGQGLVPHPPRRKGRRWSRLRISAPSRLLPWATSRTSRCTQGC